MYSEFLRPQRQHYRSIFLSDFHMGAKVFDAASLLEFLKNTESDFLYLVGDIIDGWKLNKRWFWTDDCTQVLDELMRKSANGTKIIYISGNHDDVLRELPARALHKFIDKFKIDVREKIIHRTADNRRLLVIHGDQFDRQIINGPLSKWGDRLYDWVLDLIDAHPKPHIEIKGKIKRFSLAKALSKHGQWALYLLNNFEAMVYRAAQKHQADGLICGHTHIPVLKSIKNITYGNCGAWLRGSHTALVEHDDGQLELLDKTPHKKTDDKNQLSLFPAAAMPLCTIRPDSMQYRAKTMEVINLIRDTWPPRKQDSLPAPQDLLSMVLSENVSLHSVWSHLTHQICMQADESREIMLDNISRNRFQIFFKPSFGKK